MESLEQIIQWVFGGSVDVSKITNIIVCAYSVVMSVVYAIANKKVKTTDVAETKTQSELKKAQSEISELKSCVATLSDILLTAYLSNNSVPVEVKQKIGSYGEKLQQLADIKLTSATEKLIEIATEVAPQADLESKKEEILEATEVAEEAIDAVNDVAQDAIDKIKLS